MVATLVMATSLSACLGYSDCEYASASMTWKSPGLFRSVTPGTPIDGWRVGAYSHSAPGSVPFSHPLLDEKMGPSSYWFLESTWPADAAANDVWESQFSFDMNGIVHAHWPPGAGEDVSRSRFVWFAENITDATSATVNALFEDLWSRKAPTYSLGGSALSAEGPLPGPYRLADIFDKVTNTPWPDEAYDHGYFRSSDGWVLRLGAEERWVQTAPRPPGGFLVVSLDDSARLVLYLAANPFDSYLHEYVNTTMAHVAPDLPAPPMDEREREGNPWALSCSEADRQFREGLGWPFYWRGT